MADCVGVGLLSRNLREIFNFMFRKIVLQFSEIKIILSKFRELQNFDKIILIFMKFEENFAKTKLKILRKFCKISQNKILQQPYAVGCSDF